MHFIDTLSPGNKMRVFHGPDSLPGCDPVAVPCWPVVLSKLEGSLTLQTPLRKEAETTPAPTLSSELLAELPLHNPDSTLQGGSYFNGCEPRGYCSVTKTPLT